MKFKASTLMIVASVAMAGVLVYMAIFMSDLLTEYAAFLSFILVLLIIGVIFAEFEESSITSKEVALIGILAAITAASRIPFAALPSIQPCTFLIIMTGLVFGVLAGAMVGSLTALVSNFFFGQGPWTAWQMLGWSMVGIVAGYVGRKYPNFGAKEIILLGIVLGEAYNLLLDFSSWITFYRAEPSLFLPTFIAGVPFGILHIVGNIIFAIILGVPVLALFRRFQRRFHVTYASDRGPGEGTPPERSPGS